MIPSSEGPDDRDGPPGNPRLEGPVGRLIRAGGGDLLFFGGNDYLGLAGHAELAEASSRAVREFGTSTAAARGTTGTLALHHELEAELARYMGTEAACLLASGYVASQALLRAIVEEDDVVVCAEDAHPSLRDAIPRSVETVEFFPREDPDRLGEILARHPRGVVLTDGVTPVGDLAPLDRIAPRVFAAGFRLVVDDAHAVGVLGPHGRGTADHFGLTGPGLYTVGTLSKAFGSFGGFLVGEGDLVRRVRARAMPYAASTSLPAAVVAASLAGVRIAMAAPELRARVSGYARQVSDALDLAGIRGGSGVVPIFSSRAEEVDAVRRHRHLLARGALVPVIRYPSSDDAPRLRAVVTAAHRPADVELLVGELVRPTADLDPDRDLR